MPIDLAALLQAISDQEVLHVGSFGPRQARANFDPQLPDQLGWEGAVMQVWTKMILLA
jgi:hypothetical protein